MCRIRPIRVVARQVFFCLGTLYSAQNHTFWLKIGLLTIDTLEEDVEDAVAGDRQLVLVQEAILNTLLIMLIRTKVIVLQIVQKATRDGANAFDVVDGGGKLLLAMLNCILEILECEDELE